VDEEDDDFTKIPGARLVSFREAMGMAILFQKEGHFEDAAQIYRLLMEVVPEHPDVLHYAGMVAHQQGKSDEAIALIEKSLAVVPDRADCYSNLGIIYRAQGLLDEAIAAYQRALELSPGHANAHNNLGVLLKKTGRIQDAEASYRKAIALDPGHIEAYNNLGIVLGLQKRTEEEIECYHKVRELSPGHQEARRLLAHAYVTLGDLDKAIAIYQQWLIDEPGNPIATHMLAACTGENVPARAPDGYVEAAFDAFAAHFDAKLAQLSYRAPHIVAALLKDAGVEASKSLDVLDAGCGTGLCGPLFAPYARRLVGVDLSSAMLERAKARGDYDELVKGELTEYLQRHVDTFDVIVSADTLVYFGALEQFATAAASALRPGGYLIFTLEEAVDAEDGVEYQIATHGRYQHVKGYLERVLDGARLQWYIVRAELRMESGRPVAGLAIRALKGRGEPNG
jgi:predicted TPR repeat methyltransferase